MSSTNHPQSYAAFTINARKLLNSVAWATRSVNGMGCATVNYAVEINVDNGLCLMSSCDYETSHTAQLAEDIPGNIRVQVPASLLAGYTKSCHANDDITVIVHPTGLRLTRRQWDFDIPAFGAEVPLPTFEATTIGNCDAHALATLFRQVGLCATRDTSLPALCGMQLTFDGEHINAVATDRYRAVRAQIDWEPANNSTVEPLLIPAEALLNVRGTYRRTPQGERADILVSPDQSAFGISCGGYRFMARRIDINPPDLSWLFGHDTKAMRCTVDRRQLVSAVKRVAQRGNTKVYLKPTNGHLKVLQDYHDESEVVIPATVVAAGDHGVWLTVSYLTSLLELMPGPSVTFTVSQPDRPVQLSGDTDTLFVLQPTNG